MGSSRLIPFQHTAIIIVVIVIVVVVIVVIVIIVMVIIVMVIIIIVILVITRVGGCELALASFPQMASLAPFVFWEPTNFSTAHL